MPTRPLVLVPTGNDRPTWAQVRAAVDRLLHQHAHAGTTTASATPMLFTVLAPAARPTRPSGIGVFLAISSYTSATGTPRSAARRSH